MTLKINFSLEVEVNQISTSDFEKWVGLSSKQDTSNELDNPVNQKIKNSAKFYDATRKKVK